MDKIWTILDIVKWGTDYFGKKGVDSPRLTIELLICELLTISRIDIYANFDKPLKQSELDRLRAMVIRRAKREPLQYIIGKTSFFGLEFIVEPSVLIPRPETELLVELFLKDIGKKNYQKTFEGECSTIEVAQTPSSEHNQENLTIKEPNEHFNPLSLQAKYNYSILDIGTGSGCIAIALANFLPECEILAIDYTDEVIRIAEKNAEKYNLKNIKFRKIDIFNDFSIESIRKSRYFDFIISNPPYIPKNDYLQLQPEIVNFEPRSALTDESDGLTYYKRFSLIFPKLLKDNGMFYLEIGCDQADDVTGLFENNGFAVEVVNDFSGKARIVKGILNHG